MSRTLLFINPEGLALVQQVNFAAKRMTVSLPGAVLTAAVQPDYSLELTLRTATGGEWSATTNPDGSITSGDADALCATTADLGPAVSRLHESLRAFTAPHGHSVTTLWATEACNTATLNTALGALATAAACAEGGPWTCLAAVEIEVALYQTELDVCSHG